MNNPFDYTPDASCAEGFRKLLVKIDKLKRSSLPQDVNFCRELEAGKMLGVLIAANAAGELQTLYAFSGQLGDGGFHYRDFVGPVFDYLQPDGYFKTHERDISRQNREIARFESMEMVKLEEDFRRVDNAHSIEIEWFRNKIRQSKLEREHRRQQGVTEEEGAELIRQSQFEKAEFGRLKKRFAAEAAPFMEKLEEGRRLLSEMKEQRRRDSEDLQNWLFSNFRFLNGRGEERGLREIFADTVAGVPPSGAGECCGPKLLQEAFRRGLTPLSMAEYWYGAPKEGEVRIHGEHYHACRGKCLPILSWMLQGVVVEPPLSANFRSKGAELEPEIIYESPRFCVVSKPSGMLSVPGRGDAVSVQDWLSAKYRDKEVKMVHRLDQDTSGLLVAAFTPVTYSVMQGMFASRRVKKMYVAVLEGDYRSRGLAQKGRITLSLGPDLHDRPRQKVDQMNGKEGVTDYEFIEVKDGRSRVHFYPHTGRTHQLRVSAAAESGLGMPIVGDPLYGVKRGEESSRLLLHAERLEFMFPLDGKVYQFESKAPF